MNKGMVGRTLSTRIFGIFAASLSLSTASLAQSSARPSGIDRLLQKGTATLQQLPSLFADGVTDSLEKDFTTSHLAPVALVGANRTVDGAPSDFAPAQTSILTGTVDTDSIFSPTSKPIFGKRGAKSKAKASLFDAAIASEIEATGASPREVSAIAHELMGAAAPVPEPGTMVALGIGAIGLLRRRKR